MFSIPSLTTDAELQTALAAGRQRRRTERRAASVQYDPARDTIEIELTDGAAVRLPRAMIADSEMCPQPTWRSYAFPRLAMGSSLMPMTSPSAFRA